MNETNKKVLKTKNVNSKMVTQFVFKGGAIYTRIRDWYCP